MGLSQLLKRILKRLILLLELICELGDAAVSFFELGFKDGEPLLGALKLAAHWRVRSLKTTTVASSRSRAWSRISSSAIVAGS